MNISAITKIVNEPLMSEQAKENAILHIIALDENAIPTVMKILAEERRNKKELLLDSNSELSRALVVLEDMANKKRKIIADPKWVVSEIKAHYLKWADIIKCNFKVTGLP